MPKRTTLAGSTYWTIQVSLHDTAITQAQLQVNGVIGINVSWVIYNVLCSTIEVMRLLM